MSDPLLGSRLDALSLQLDRAIETAWLHELPGGPAVREDVWKGLNASVGKQANQLKGRLNSIRDLLREVETGTPGADGNAGLKDAWAEYGTVLEASQEMFDEFLEFIGGLAFREQTEKAFGDHGERGSIFRVADDLVRTCSDETIAEPPWRSITVLAPQETVKATLARIVRLRFPDLSIWTLPAVIHEFGHGVMESEGFADFVVDQARQWSKGRARPGRSKGLDSRTAQLHGAEFGADAFATYYLGPAYACASIHLKLDLLGRSDGRTEAPSGSARAHVILSMLDDMDRASPNRAGVFDEVLDKLREDWERASASAEVETLTPDETARIGGFVTGVRELLRNYLMPSAPYPVGDPGWLAAEKWLRHWEAEGQDEVMTTPTEGVSKLSTLRDALNAAWAFRLFHEDETPVPCIHVKMAQRKALELCDLIIEKQNEKPSDETLGRSGRGGPP
jgi:hypothetical protein